MKLIYPNLFLIIFLIVKCKTKTPPLSRIKLLGYFLYINAQSLTPSPFSWNVPSSQTV